MTLRFDHLPTFASPLGRLDPRWRLAALLVLAAAAALLYTLPAAAALFGLSLVLAWAGRLPARWYGERLSLIVPFLLLFAVWLPFFSFGRGAVWELGPVHVSAYGVRLAALLCLKALTIVTLMLVALASAPLHVTLQAAHRLRLPGLLVQLGLLSYRYVLLLAAELARVRIALRVRGYRNRAGLHSYRTIGHVAGTLLVRSFERAERVGQAMRCRGFDGQFRSLATFRTTAAEVGLFVVLAVAAVGCVAWDLVQR
jgi:cobalt/nickel transport system permease protein